MSVPLVRDATAADLPAVAAIYDRCVRDSVATFDTEERGAAYLGTALASLGPADGFLVLEHGGAVVGYAVSGPFRPRPAYNGTRETSVYLAEQMRGRGLGRLLYAALLARLDAAGAHTQVAVVALPNEASEALHRALGFELAGVLHEVGRKFGRWVDTAWYQRFGPLETAPGGEPTVAGTAQVR